MRTLPLYSFIFQPERGCKCIFGNRPFAEYEEFPVIHTLFLFRSYDMIFITFVFPRFEDAESLYERARYALLFNFRNIFSIIFKAGDMTLTVSKTPFNLIKRYLI